jgi:DNA-binding IclR family transcriptional regulator
MSKTLLRGLDLIEEVGRVGSATVSELARRSGVHITIVSRTVSALEREGWLTKVRGRVTVGPRSALLATSSPASATIWEAEPLVRAIAGATGLATQAGALVGGDLMILTSAGVGIESSAETMLSRVPLNALAAGRAVAAQLPPEQLDAVLPAEPYPDAADLLGSITSTVPVEAYLANFSAPDSPPSSLPRTRAALDAELEQIRATGLAYDHGGLHPGIHCIAAPWPTPTLPAALACFGGREAVESGAVLIEACLRAAVRPGATAPDVIAAAAARMG